MGKGTPSGFWQRQKKAVQDWQRSEIANAIEAAGGNQTLAARMLGIDRSNMLRLMRKLRREP